MNAAVILAGILILAVTCGAVVAPRVRRRSRQRLARDIADGGGRPAEVAASLDRARRRARSDRPPGPKR